MLAIPLHPALAAIIAATPNDHLTFLVTSFGNSFTAPGFGNWFREQCNKAENNIAAWRHRCACRSNSERIST